MQVNMTQLFSLPGISLLELLQVFAFEYLININITYHEKTSKHRKMFYTVIPDIFDFILTEFVVLSLLCLVRCSSSSNKNETSLEADEPDHNHEEKLKTYEEKKLVSADQPSLRRTPGAKDRERFHKGC